MKGLLLLPFLFLSVFYFYNNSEQAPEARQEVQPIENEVLVRNDSLKLLFAPANTYYNFANDSGVIYVYTEFKAPFYTPAESKARTPLNISLVIDKSGSMTGEKIEFAKKAAEFVVDNLSPEDYISVVIYDSDVKTLFTSQKVKNKTLLKNLLKSIQPGSSTNLSGGMLEGYTQVESTYKSGYVNRVMLMSDGLANQGITDNEALFEIARKKLRENGISISTFGVGVDYNEDLMTGLAENGNGNYYFIANPEEIPGIFKKELNGLLNLYAQNTKIKIYYPKELQLNKVLGLQTEKGAAGEVIINLRDIFSEETKGCVLKFTYNNNQKNALPFEAVFSWNDMSRSAQSTSYKQAFTITYQPDKEMITKAENKFVWQQVYLFESNELLQQTMQLVDKRDFDGAKKMSGYNSFYMKKARSKVEFNKELEKQDSININYGNKIEEAKDMDDNEYKMYQKSNKSENYKMRNRK